MLKKNKFFSKFLSENVCYGSYINRDIKGRGRKHEKDGLYASFTNTKSCLSSGSYRLKSVFTVIMSDGQTETVTVYSDTKTV